MCADTPEYKDTLNLPRTDFPMRAGLPTREPLWLERWNKLDIYGQLRAKAAANCPERHVGVRRHRREDGIAVDGQVADVEGGCAHGSDFTGKR